VTNAGIASVRHSVET